MTQTLLDAIANKDYEAYWLVHSMINERGSKVEKKREKRKSVGMNNDEFIHCLFVLFQSTLRFDDDCI